MKRSFIWAWLIILTMSGCNLARTAKTIPPSISNTPTVMVTPAPIDHISFSLTQPGDKFIDMAVLPDHKIWAVSAQGTIIQDSLEPTYLPQRYVENLHSSLTSAKFLSSNDGWITSRDGQIFHWDGKSWDHISMQQSTISLEDIDFVDKDHGWAVGCDDAEVQEKYKAVLVVWNGYNWENISLLDDIGTDNFCLISIDVVSNTDIWAVGEKYPVTVGAGMQFPGILLHWDGSFWHEISSPKEMRFPNYVNATGPDDVWVNSNYNMWYEYIFHWNGHTWSQKELPTYFKDNYADKPSLALRAISKDNAWLGGLALVHWDGTKWNKTSYDGKNGNIIDIETTTDGKIWVLTDIGMVWLVSD